MLPVNPFYNLLEEEHPIGTEIEVTLIDGEGDCRHNCINFIGKGNSVRNQAEFAGPWRLQGLET